MYLYISIYSLLYITDAIYVVNTCPLVPGLVSPRPSSMGTFFTLEGTIYQSYSTWLMIFHVDLIPYKEHLQNLHGKIGMYKRFMKQYDIYSHKQNKWRDLNQIHTNIHELIFKEHEQILYEYHQVMTLYNELESLVTKPPISLCNKRTKRALLPFIEKGLSWLF